MKSKLFFSLSFVLILILTPLVLAGNYGAGSYGVDNYGIGEVILTPETPSGGSSGGGGGCTYDWQCTKWFPSICPELEKQERICVNRGTCSGTTGMPNQTQTCEYLGPSEPLFDIYLTLGDKYKEICAGEKIKANVKLENYAKVELLDAFMTYWVIDENNKLIAEYKDTRAVEKETSFNIELKIPDSTAEGTYRLYAEITYSGNKTAVTGESFEILSKEDCVLFSAKDFNRMYLVYGVAGVVIVLIVLLLIKSLKRFKITRRKTGKPKTHREYRNKIKQNLKRIRGKHFLMFILGISLIAFFFIVGNSITGFAVNNNIENSINWNIFGFIFIVLIFGLMTFFIERRLLK
ncbi:MAG: hypothetical protein ABIB79_01860 [archaeon]